jgi:hypothetical protein
VNSEIAQKHLPELDTLHRHLSGQVFGSGGRYFDPDSHRPFFERAIRTIARLKELDPHLFGDIENLEIPQSSGTTDFQGRGYFTLAQFRPLGNAIDRCLALIRTNLEALPGKASQPPSEIDDLIRELTREQSSSYRDVKDEIGIVGSYRIKVIALIERYCGRESKLLEEVSRKAEIKVGDETVGIKLLRCQYAKWISALQEAKKYSRSPTKQGGLCDKFISLFHSKAWGYVAAIVGVASSLYVYLYSQRPILDVIPAAAPVQAEWKNESHRFDIPFEIKNLGQATAVGHSLYHVFFNYPPSFEDLRATDAPDVAPNTSRPFSVVKYIRTKNLLASVNFFHYQNLIIISQWKSDNLAHTGLTFHHALWCRLHYNPLGQSALSVIKSRYYLHWFGTTDSAFKAILRKFTKGENIQDAYDLEYLNFKRGEK